MRISDWSSDVCSSDLKLTAGFFIAKSKSEDLRLLGNNLLLLAEPNARRIDLRLNNGVQASRDGFVSATTGQVVGGSDSTNVALFLSDKWSASDSTTIDAGDRKSTRLNSSH